MSDTETHDPVMEEALDLYSHADKAPAIALALREHARRVRAAWVATRALCDAVAEHGYSAVLSSDLRFRHPVLLRAHQETWAAACSPSPIRNDAQVGAVLNRLWLTVCMKIILDRMCEVSTSRLFGKIQFVRIFGTISSKLHEGIIMVTNRNYCTVFTVSDSDDWSFDRIIPAMDAALRWIKESTEIQPFIPSEAPRVIYSYGPIGNNDHEIRIDAIYEFLAALKMVEMTLVSAADFFAKTIKDKRSVWDYLDKNKISNLRLQKELKKSGLTVELETLKKARSRRRQERSRAKAPTT